MTRYYSIKVTAASEDGSSTSASVNYITMSPVLGQVSAAYTITYTTRGKVPGVKRHRDLLLLGTG